MGYGVASQLYGDPDGRKDRHGLMMIGRHDMIDGDVHIVRLAERSALHLCVYDQIAKTNIDVIGLHLDDRLESKRLERVEALLDYIERLWEQVGKRSVVAMGDFNAIEDGIRAALFRVMGYIAGLLPQHEPGTPKPDKHGIEFLRYIAARAASLANRLGGMAAGDTMRLLREYGFEDDGRRHPSTMPSNFPIAELDRVVALGATVSNYMTLDALGDHKGVGGTITPTL